MMNAKQKLDAAMRRLEDAAARLRQAALTYAKAEPGRWDQVIGDRELSAAARSYSAALSAIRRAGRGK